ncbi:membrane-bound lytic murein transglycosylase F [Ferrigenium kumadai]|uniref:Membrane-bound lytic murein transglycosylase F n=1 Tax=Ferrigenium kumadai TaxID=1682490 RepID=A0AAN1VYZ4_9PROT|nr:membrane-bound lytic murein transglycosylase F [Ferrigenium kumadai]
MSAATLGICVLLAGCGQQLPSWRNDKLLVIVPDASQGAEAEFERELATIFAEHLHSTVELIPSPPNKIDRALRRHRAHLAAASLRSEINVSALHFGPSYQTVREQLICNRDHKQPRRLADLQGMSLAVPVGSAPEAALMEARANFSPLKWESRRNTTTEGLIREVSDGTLDCTVANENRYASARNYYSNLVATLDIGTPSKLAWAFSRDVDPALYKEAQAFFSRIERDGTLNRLLERYYGHNNRLQTLDAASFIANINQILPKYRNLFEEAATLTGIDWRLLAALAYQESQWDPLATSFTNVRGMMMLTEETADRMNVTNRLDARESIIAGAKYLALIRDQMPERIAEPDRTWMSLAAYNQGYGHLEDARVLTKRMGMNPDSWADVKKWMPLLNQPGYYETLKYGYARGGEAVILVESIRSYHDMLERLAPDATAFDSNAISYRLIEPLKRLLR